ncbi:MAG: hypothetical protein FWE24_09215 [Defluviitaleaceae bacterium]|nr:hypothetical protein [Defluviitaleaceae bacterium]
MANELPPKALLAYINTCFKDELEAKHIANYNTLMLYYIAQPTRKNPDSLSIYKPLFESNRAGRSTKKEMSGEEILAGLIKNGRGEK